MKRRSGDYLAFQHCFPQQQGDPQQQFCRMISLRWHSTHCQLDLHRSDVLSENCDQMNGFHLDVLATLWGHEHYLDGSAFLGHLKVEFCFRLLRLKPARQMFLEWHRWDCDGDVFEASCCHSLEMRLGVHWTMFCRKMVCSGACKGTGRVSRVVMRETPLVPGCVQHVVVIMNSQSHSCYSNYQLLPSDLNLTVLSCDQSASPTYHYCLAHHPVLELEPVSHAQWTTP